MNMSLLATLLAMSPPTQPGQTAPPIWIQLAPMVLIFVIFYFLLIRPQQKKAKEHELLLKTIKPGDKVLAAGILGVVTGVREKSVVIRSEEAKFEMLKSAVTEILERAEGSEKSDKA
jgi:preprotein translocase subunit YajC